MDCVSTEFVGTASRGNALQYEHLVRTTPPPQDEQQCLLNQDGSCLLLKLLTQARLGVYC